MIGRKFLIGSITAMAFLGTTYFLPKNKCLPTTSPIIQTKTVQQTNNKDSPLVDGLKEGPHSMFVFNKNIIFRDNNSVGMRAYIKIENKELELERDYVNQESAHFKIPESIFNASRGYEVRAVDRHGNIMNSRIYTLEGVVSDKPFID